MLNGMPSFFSGGVGSKCSDTVAYSGRRLSVRATKAKRLSKPSRARKESPEQRCVNVDSNANTNVSNSER